MNMILAILWTFVLIMRIFDMLNGGEPTWLDVILPLICLVLDNWTAVRRERR